MEIVLKAEIGWFDEDGEFIDNDLKIQVTEKVADLIYKKLENEMAINISKVVNEKLDLLISKTYNNFLNEDIILTDDYGDEKSRGKLKDIIKKRFDRFMTEEVDERGRASGYGCSLTRMEYFIETQLKNHTEKFTKDTIKRVTEELEKQLEKDLKNAIGDTIVKKIGLKNLLPKKV